MLGLGPLYGGGYWVALRQLAVMSPPPAPPPSHRAGRPPLPPSSHLPSAHLLRRTAAWDRLMNVSLACVQVYYAAGAVLHYVVPALFPVKSVQKGQPRQGQVTSEALYSLGAPPSPPLLPLVAAFCMILSAPSSLMADGACALFHTSFSCPIAIALQARCSSRRACGRS